MTFPAASVIIGMRFLLFQQTEVLVPASPGGSHLWKFLSPLFAVPLNSLVASTLAVLLIATLIRAINNRFALIRTRSNLPFIAPLLLLSLHPRFLVMTPALAAVIIVLLAFFPLLQSYQKPEAYLCSFRSGILIAVASLFHIGALALVPFWWRGERSMRGPQLRAFSSFLFGILLVGFSLFPPIFCWEIFLVSSIRFTSIPPSHCRPYLITPWLNGLPCFLSLFSLSRT